VIANQPKKQGAFFGGQAAWKLAEQVDRPPLGALTMGKVHASCIDFCRHFRAVSAQDPLSQIR